jgi:tRNA threonylcarbamoyladenosine biosynthesis protein TsaE
MKTVIETDVTEVKKLAADIAKGLQGGEVFGLVGPLGSGKTTFTKALAKELTVPGTVTSPTFIIMNLFKGKLQKKNKIFFYHLDLYRCKGFAEVKALGITEFWGKPDTITVIEWANKISRYLPKKTKIIKFKSLSVSK